MKRAIILTGSELRHTFMRKYIALDNDIEMVTSYCEGQERSLRAVTNKDDAPKDLRLKHLAARDQTEKDFFSLFNEASQDNSNPVYLAYGDINTPKYANKIIEADPDILIAYGCSIIKEPLLSHFEGRFLNVHLGLSPYYRGSGTNFWPLVNGEPEFVGATFMHIDAGIDTGNVIHQIRARYEWGDTPSQIGNRLICDVASTYREIIKNFDSLHNMPQLPPINNNRLYKQRDYTEESVESLYKHFNSGLIETYLAEEETRCARSPIISNSALT